MTATAQLCTLRHFRQWGDGNAMTIQHGDVDDGIEPIRQTFNADNMREIASIAWTDTTTGRVTLWEIPKCWVVWMLAASERCKKGEFHA